MNLIQGLDESISQIKVLEKIIETQRREIFQLKCVLDNLPGSIYWKDKNGVCLGRNLYSAEKMQSVYLEKEVIRDAAIGKTDYDFFPKEIADRYRKHDIEVMQTGNEISVEEPLTLANGQTIIQLSSKRPLYDEEGNISGIVGNTVDITYLKKIEAELRAAKEKAEAANKIKTEFIRNMEHDIRTPFNGIWGIANILFQREIEHEKKELLGDITACAKELLDYCDGILDFSKIEEGSLPIIEKKFDLKKLILSILKIETPAAKYKKLNFNLRYAKDIEDILIGDQYRLKRILLNLISNAIKFTKKGNVDLDIKLGKREERRLIIKFIIRDTGIGISKEKQAYLYERFSKGIESNRGLYKGIGVGLRIVKQFIEEMDGEIDVVSKVNIGTTFTCIVPFKLPLLNDPLEENA